MPNFVPMETQVLSGILPISKVSAIPACIHHASQFLPLERMFDLKHPVLSTPAVEDKRTWRQPRDRDQSEKPKPAWTAMDVLTAYANAKSLVTARAGRPDVNRAGNAVLRALAEGRVRWAFWPPGTDPSMLSEAGDGIWISSGDGYSAGVDSESDGEKEGIEQDHGSESGEEGSQEDDFPGDDDDEEEAELNEVGVGGRFGALALQDVATESTEEE